MLDDKYISKVTTNACKRRIGRFMSILTYIASRKAAELSKSKRLEFIVADFGVK